MGTDLTKVSNHLPRIAIDAMGGDFGPASIVEGAIEASRNLEANLFLVGDPNEINSQLKGRNYPEHRISVVEAKGKVGEHDHPIMALKRNPEASIVVAINMIKEDRADAVVSMGPTGASMACASLTLGLFEGLERPCVGGPFVGLSPNTAILDLGSNIDCRPHQLFDFAVMGCVYARKFFGINDPRVGILSVGAEEGKGNKLVRESYQMFKNSNLNFIGNVEGTDLLSDKANVVVCDGFVGNILLKFAEAMGDGLYEYLKHTLAGRINENELEELATAVWGLTNRSRMSSGPFFGVQGNVVVGHGASRYDEVAAAIVTANRCIEVDLLDSIKRELHGFQQEREVN
jgi:glycerol-3-phosphate acyltransferase PlsX